MTDSKDLQALLDNLKAAVGAYVVSPHGQIPAPVPTVQIRLTVPADQVEKFKTMAIRARATNTRRRRAAERRRERGPANL